MTQNAPEGYRLPEDDSDLLAECRVDVFRASGPGGQGVNTADSAVRLTHLPTGIVVVCREHRSQLRNKQACLVRLRARVERLMAPPPAPRHKTRPSRAAREKRLAAKSRRGSTKVARQRPASEE